MRILSSVSFLASLCIMCICIGYGLGRIRAVSIHTASAIHVDMSATGAFVPTVHLQGIKNKQVYGTAVGDIRVFVGDAQVDVQSGSFISPAGPLLVHEVDIVIPDGIHFVASKKGKKYYSVFSKKAQSITPENRIYFQNEVSAIQAGYKK